MSKDTEAASQPREGEVETATRAIFEADPDVGMTWDAFVALADKEPDFQQVVDGQRRAGKAAVEAIGKMRWQTADTAVADVLAQPDAQIEAEATAEDRAWAAGFKTGSLTQRPPEQAGAVPAGDLALMKAVRFTAYDQADPLAIRFEFADDADRLEAADEIDVILSEAFAQARARMATALAEARIGRDGPAKVRVKPAAPTPPDAGPGEIPAGMGGDNNPCRNCGTEYPRPMRTAANTPPDELARIQLLADVELHLQSVRIFLTKREKMHPCGVELHDELQARVTEALTPKAPPQTPPDAGIGSDGAGERG